MSLRLFLKSTKSDFTLEAFKSEEEDKCTRCVEVVVDKLDDFTRVVVELDWELLCN